MTVGQGDLQPEEAGHSGLLPRAIAGGCCCEWPPGIMQHSGPECVHQPLQNVVSHPAETQGAGATDGVTQEARAGQIPGFAELTFSEDLLRAGL